MAQQYPCGNHNPVQHRDGKPAWCPLCGKTADGKTPTSNIPTKDEEAVFVPADRTPQDKARRLVFEYYNDRAADRELEPIIIEQVRLVWFSKVLTVWQALVCTDTHDGRYYELTYNGNATRLNEYIQYNTVRIPD